MEYKDSGRHFVFGKQESSRPLFWEHKNLVALCVRGTQGVVAQTSLLSHVADFRKSWKIAGMGRLEAPSPSWQPCRKKAPLLARQGAADI